MESETQEDRRSGRFLKNPLKEHGGGFLDLEKGVQKKVEPKLHDMNEFRKKMKIYIYIYISQ